MRIFTKKAFKFMNRENGSFVKTQPFSFQDVPEWVKKDPIYALAAKEGSIEIIETKQRQKQLENDPNAKKNSKRKSNPAAEGSEAAGLPDPEDKKENDGEDKENPEGAEPDKE